MMYYLQENHNLNRTARTYTGLGKQTLRGQKQNLVQPGPRRKEWWPQKRLTQTCPWVSRSLWGRHGLTVAGWRVGGTECLPGTFWRRLQLSSLSPPEFGLRSNNREGTQPRPSTENGLKIYWVWPRPSEQDPVSPQSVSPIRKLP